MKRAYVVSGPESAGNRLVAAVLVSAGCRGNASTTGEWNGEGLPLDASPAVVIRSLPHGGLGEPRPHELIVDGGEPVGIDQARNTVRLAEVA